MKCQKLFSGKNKKNISVCRLLKILLRVLSVKVCRLRVNGTGIVLTRDISIKYSSTVE